MIPWTNNNSVRSTTPRVCLTVGGLLKDVGVILDVAKGKADPSIVRILCRPW